MALSAIVVSVLLGLVKFFAAKAKRQKKRADMFEAAVDRQSDIQAADSELSKDYQSEKAKIVKEIEEGEEVTSLSDPNSWD